MEKLLYFSELELAMEPFMVEAFRAVLVIMPSPPLNPDYHLFTEKCRLYSTQPPFNATKLPRQYGLAEVRQ